MSSHNYRTIVRAVEYNNLFIECGPVYVIIYKSNGSTFLYIKLKIRFDQEFKVKINWFCDLLYLM